MHKNISMYSSFIYIKVVRVVDIHLKGHKDHLYYVLNTVATVDLGHEGPMHDKMCY